MRVAIYARVSTENPKKPGLKSQSPEMQLFALRNYAASRNFIVVEEYVDKGVSGSKTSRPQLDKLMDAARKRKFDAVLVWKFDRWARSVQHLVETLGEFRNLGVQFLSYSENIDTSSPMGAAMFSIIAAMAQLERDLIVERTLAGLAAARALGKVGGPKVRLHKEQEVLRLREEPGNSIRKIAKKLGVSVGYVHDVIASARITSSVA
jgi:DNA invertase Pin-like site-specific DNA recombinase